MRVLLARVGYIKYYQGSQVGDEKPLGGGAYTKDNLGHERYNYKIIDGKVHGYFQPQMRSGLINLERIDPKASGKAVDGVLVIWFAKNPVAKGQVIIGWYKDATVFRSMQKDAIAKQRGGCAYNVVAEAEDATLLPPSKRIHTVGHRLKNTREGNPGQSNVFYLYESNLSQKKLSDRRHAWIQKAIDYVNNYQGPNSSDFEERAADEVQTAINAGGQGFVQDLKNRMVIEAHAMSICRTHYRKNGYDAEDVHKWRSYDLHLRHKKNPQEILVEVKGTQTPGDKIILTRKEVDLSPESKTPMASRWEGPHNKARQKAHSLSMEGQGKTPHAYKLYVHLH